MKKILPLILLLLTFAVSGKTLVWSDALNDVKRWQFTANNDGLVGGSNWSSGNCFVFPLAGNTPGIRYEMRRIIGKKDLFGAVVYTLHDYESLQGAEQLLFDGTLSIAPGSKLLELYVQFGEKKFSIPLTPDGKVQSVKIDLKEIDPSCRNLRFYIKTDGKFGALELRNMHIKGKNAAVPPVKFPVTTALAVRPGVPGGAFYVDEELSFNFVIPQNEAFTVTDMYGKIHQQGMAKPGKNVLKKLPCGYYFIKLDDSGRYINNRYFAVVERRLELPAGKESSYAIGGDIQFAGPMTDIPAFPGMRGFELAELASRMGLYTIRSLYYWLKWDYIYYQQGKEKFHQDAMDAGVKVTHMINPLVETRRMQNDLFVVYNRLAKETSRDWAKRWKYMEFWNEPESFGMTSTWQLAAIAKAAYLAIKKNAPALPVQSPAFFRGDIVREMLKNGYADYFDILNVHVYDHMAVWNDYFAGHHEVLNEYGLGDRPLHVTEAGVTIDGSGELDSLRKGNKTHSLQQEILSGIFTVKSQIMLQALGVDLTYTFCFAAYNEMQGLKDWSCLRYDNSVKANYVAFSNLAKTLADADYLGTYDLAAGCEAYLFRKPDKSQVLVAWNNIKKENALTAPNQTVEIPVKDGTYILKDNFGFTRTVKAVNGKLALPVGYSPVFLTGVSGLKVAKPAMVRKGSYKTPENLDTAVVLNPVCSKDFELEHKKRYVLPLKKDGRITIQIYNFSNVAKTGSLSYKGGSVSGDPGIFTLKPMERKNFEIKVTPLFPENGYQTDFSISGKFNGKEISPANIPMKDLNRIHYRSIMLDYTKLDRWFLACNGSMTHRIAPDDKKTVEFLYHGKPGKAGPVAWCSPGYNLQKNETFKDAIGIQFDIKLSPEAAKLYWYSIIFFNPARGAGQKLPSKIEKYTEWQTVTVFFMERLKNLDKIKNIQLDVESREFQNLKFSYRNIKILYPEKKELKK